MGRGLFQGLGDLEVKGRKYVLRNVPEELVFLYNMEPFHVDHVIWKLLNMQIMH